MIKAVISLAEKIKIIIKIPDQNKMIQIECLEEESIMEAILRHGVYVPAECGGRGACGKCKIRLIDGELPITRQDKMLFNEAWLRQGYRLSCKAHPKKECTIELAYESNSQIFVVSENALDKSKINLDTSNAEIDKYGEIDKYTEIGTNTDTTQILPAARLENSFGIAVDLGTTTIAISLIGMQSGRIYKTYTKENPQRRYGADVITRMEASNKGKLIELRDCVRRGIIEGIIILITEEEVSINHIEKIVIAGNTTMSHLFMGYSCETLGSFPFTPVNIEMIQMNMTDIFSTKDYQVNIDIPEIPNIPVILLPGISTFVGGDIVAGLMVCGFLSSEKPWLLIDIGTNGEMALGTKEDILVTSTAAGPAFEGGNITCGVSSIPGAISHVTLKGDEIHYETIDEKPPIGICGTGVIDLTSELWKEGIIDNTGLLINPYFHEGYRITDLTFLQKDIREIQLAKAAIRAGIEILISRYGISYDQIDQVYLAGGFGYKIDIQKAIHIGLLPKELSGKIKAVGNSSLAGAIKYLTDSKAKEDVEKLRTISREIHLSNDEEFNELYINYMSF
ncbi:DUF4445 domain-containing protein [Mobilitalea sibirica]|uniref:DUF4445 domain-containing protein n=1 Tax=Mobilitalea sibirica TaxID=1462919 RepID=A0A8J7H1U8_9FIRM|nr:ASKHA domain-containing protein [Mobilitalea sibirica]MBH1940544.1 DUF4445 domain-containing protein [Mobilitalea sibirica]